MELQPYSVLTNTMARKQFIKDETKESNCVMILFN